jgi:CPA2 family monovalent cation:H+ antiporter-2
MIDQLMVLWIFGIGLGIAAIFGYIAKKLRLSPVIGYLLAGFMIGPHAPGFVADPVLSEQLAYVGVILLMFAVGLHFDWGDLINVRQIVLPGALSVAAVVFGLGYFLADYLGEGGVAGIILGVSLVVSSTVVIVRLLSDYSLLNTKSGHIIVGWTVVEDLISILFLILLPGLKESVSGGVDGSLFYTLGIAFLKMISLALIVYVVGEKAVSWVLKSFARTRSHELFTVATLAVVFLIAAGSATIFGVSIALGAFIAGTVIGKTEVSHQAAANALPMRDAFAVIFFLSVGMLADPVAVSHNIPLFLGILAIVLLIKPLLAFGAMRLGGYAFPTAATLALAVGQMGEYSFILVEEGSRDGLLSDEIFDVVVAASLVSIMVNTFLFRAVKYFTQTPASKDTPPIQLKEVLSPPSKIAPKAVVAGFGPVGQSAVETLLEKGYEVEVIDQNIDAVPFIQNRGLKTLFGDASQTLVLEKSSLAEADVLIVAVPDPDVALGIVKSAEYVNPYLKFIVRVRYQAKKSLFEGKPYLLVCDEELAGDSIRNLLANYLQ